MDCRSSEKYINAYLDKDLSAGKEKIFKAHLAGCADCRREFDQYRLMKEQLDGLEVLSPAEGFEGRILSKMEPYKEPARDPRRDLVLIIGYFITLFAVLNVLTTAAVQNLDWISAIVVVTRVFRDVFDGLIFQGMLSLFIIYPIRIFNWARIIFSELSPEGRMAYSLVIITLLMLGAFSRSLLQKMSENLSKEH